MSCTARNAHSNDEEHSIMEGDEEEAMHHAYLFQLAEEAGNQAVHKPPDSEWPPRVVCLAHSVWPVQSDWPER